MMLLAAKIKEIRTSDDDEKTKQAKIQMINQEIQSLQQQKQQIQLQVQREQVQKQTEEEQEKEKEKQEDELKDANNNIDNNKNDIIVSDSLTSLLQADSSKKISQDLKSTEASMKVTESYVEDMKSDSVSGLGVYHDTSGYDNQLSKLNSGISNIEGQANDEIGKSLDSIEIATEKAKVEAAKDKNDDDSDNDKIDDKDEQNNDDKNSLYKEAEVLGEKVDKYA